MSKSSSLIGLVPGRPSNDRKAPTLSSLQDKPTTVRINFDLDSEAHLKLKLHAVAKGISISDFLRQLVASALSG